MAIEGRTIAEGFVKVGSLTDEFEGDLERKLDIALGRVSAGSAERLGAVGDVMTRRVTPAATALAIAAGRVFNTFDRGEDTIRVVTGATGAAFDRLLEQAKDLAGESTIAFDQVASALAQIAARTDLRGEGLRDLTEAILQLTELTGGDATANAELFTRVLESFNVEASRSVPILDLFLRASQATGESVQTIAERVLSARIQLEGLGLTLEESIALTAQAGPEFDRIVSAIRIGIANLSQAGVQDIGAAFRDVVDDIRNARTEVEANNRAIEVFGARAGPQLAALIREGRLEFADFARELANGRETIQGAREDIRDFSDAVREAANRVIGAVGPYSEFIASFATIAAGAGPAAQGASAVARAVAGQVRQIQGLRAAAALGGEAMGTMAASARVLGAGIGLATAKIAAIILVVTEIIKLIPEASKSFDFFKEHLDDAFDFDAISAGDRFAAVMNGIKETFTFEGGAGFDEFFSGFNDKMDELRHTTGEVPDETREVADAIGELTGEAIAADDATSGLTDSLDEGAEADKRRVITARDVQRAYREAADAAREQRLAELDLTSSLLGIQAASLQARDAEQSLADARLAVERLENRRQVGTVKHREALDALARAQLDAVGGQLGLAQSVAQYVIENARGDASQRTAIKLINSYGRDAGLTTREIRNLTGSVLGLVEEYRNLPASKTTEANFIDDEARRRLARLKREIDSIPRQVDIKVNTETTTTSATGQPPPPGFGAGAGFQGPPPPPVEVNINLDGRTVRRANQRRESLLSGG